MPPDVRKTVTIVFCDMVGSTALGERSDPEVLRELMRRYHATLRTILERHGASVEKFVGDAAMAVFGIPRVHEDDPLRAVRAAVEMREAVRPLGLDVRIGVNTGEVLAGGGETLVTGDAVNLAARLEQAAGTGEILIGASTAELVGASVRSEAVAPLTLKGKRDPVPAFRVLEVVAGAAMFPRSSTTPFVGREVERVQLERALATAVERRVPQLATVVGPPGIGKSRLVRELLVRSQARVLAGRCLSYGEGITYWPLREIAEQIGDVRSALGTAPDRDVAALRVDAALGVAGATATPDEIAWGVRKLFESIAREAPLIVVLDDIHWAEPALLDLVEYVAAFAQDVPLFLLCTARPELFERRPAWATPRPKALVLTLEPLLARDTTRLVDSLRALSAEQRERIVDAAEGNPLFVEQLVAMQAERGGDALLIPPTLQALLAARIDGLASGERAVLECGSVEGRVFHRGGVAHLVPETERSGVGAELLTLVRKELIRPDRAAVPGDDAFRFGHVLIRDAAYDAMPKRQRAALHEEFADWLASRLGDAAPDEIVGYHLEQAARYRRELGVPDAALGSRAADRLSAAARAARARDDTAAAANLFGRAAALLAEGDARLATALVEHGEALRSHGDLAAAGEVFARAMALARASNDTTVEWRARIGAAEVRIWREPEGAAQLALDEGNGAIATLPDDEHEVLARAWILLSDAALLRSQMAERWRTSEEALRHARAAGDRTLEVAIVQGSAPAILFGETSAEDGMRYIDEVLARLGDVPGVRSFGLHVMGHLRARRGEFAEAREAIDAWRTHMKELGRVAQHANTAGCAYDVLALAGEWAAAEREVREGSETLARMGDRASRSTAVAYLGVACFEQGKIDEAERWAKLSAELGASDDTMNEATWRSLHARVLAARGERGEAVALARTAVELADRTDYIDLQGDARRDLADVLGGGPEAVRALDEAIARYERKGNRVSAERARALRMRIAGRPA
jgi:class 3 adenylate cyclase/tetratricopeptide (TPR) repeat protein